MFSKIKFQLLYNYLAVIKLDILAIVLTTEVCSKNKYFSYFEYVVQVLNPFQRLKNISKAIKSSNVDSLLCPFAFSLDFKKSLLLF